LGALAYWLVSRKRDGKATLIDPGLFGSKLFRFGVSGQLLQQVALGGTMIVLPIYLQMVFGYNALQAGLSIAPLSLSMFVIALVAGRRFGGRRPSTIIRLGFTLLLVGLVAIIPIVPRADAGWYLAIPLIIGGSGLGLLVSQLNNYTLSPISEERVSEAAGVNSAAGSFGLSFGLAFAGAIMLATLATSFTTLAQSSTVLPPEDKQQVATVLEDDAEVMSDAQLQAILADETPAVQDEVLQINDQARNLALQVALLVPILAAALGLVNSFRMVRLPDPTPSGAAEMVLGG
ncbi:MAG: MFS transporter, partial [Chloroflexota bacterium]